MALRPRLARTVHCSCASDPRALSHVTVTVARRLGFTLCKVLQMRETVSTVPHSTLLLPLDKVVLETVYVHVWGGGVCRRALACATQCEREGRVLVFGRRALACVRGGVCTRLRAYASERRACVWRALSFPDA